MLACVLLLALSPAPAPLPALEPVGMPVTLATLTPAEAARLEGRTKRYRIVLTSSAVEEDGWTGYDVEHKDDPAVMGSVYLRGGEIGEPGDAVVVEARLRVIRHPKRGSQGPVRRVGRVSAYRRGKVNVAEAGARQFVRRGGRRGIRTHADHNEQGRAFMKARPCSVCSGLTASSSTPETEASAGAEA
jgi:hypothetical protein